VLVCLILIFGGMLSSSFTIIIIQMRCLEHLGRFLVNEGALIDFNELRL